MVDTLILANINVRGKESYEQKIDPIVVTQESDAKQTHYGFDGSRC
jgi:hypothetical protein